MPSNHEVRHAEMIFKVMVDELGFAEVERFVFTNGHHMSFASTYGRLSNSFGNSGPLSGATS